MSPVISSGSVLKAADLQNELTHTLGISLREHSKEFLVNTRPLSSKPEVKPHLFMASNWTKWCPTRPQQDTLDEQVGDPTILQAREAFNRSFRNRRSPQDVLKIAERLGIQDAFPRQFEVLARLGCSPFETSPRSFTLRDYLGNPQEETDPQSFSNVGTQALFTACCAWVLGDALHQAGHIEDAELSWLKMASPWQKLFKPEEILDRIALRNSIFHGHPDSPQRIAMHRDRYVKEGIMNKTEAARAYRLVTHTCGLDGFFPFLTLSETGFATISSGDASFTPLMLGDVNIRSVGEMEGKKERGPLRILRALDDITVAMGSDYGLTEPHNKILQLSKTRGDGLQGHILCWDKARGYFTPRDWRTVVREYPDKDLSTLLTFGTAQDLISTVILCEHYHALKADPENTFRVDPANEHAQCSGGYLEASHTQKIIKALNRRLDQLVA